MNDHESSQARHDQGFRTRIFFAELPEQEARKKAANDKILRDVDVEYLQEQREPWRNRETWVVYCGHIMGVYRTL